MYMTMKMAMIVSEAMTVPIAIACDGITAAKQSNPRPMVRMTNEPIRDRRTPNRSEKDPKPNIKSVTAAAKQAVKTVTHLSAT